MFVFEKLPSHVPKQLQHLNSHRDSMRISILSHLCKHFLWAIFLMSRLGEDVVLICVALMINDVETHFMYMVAIHIYFVEVSKYFIKFCIASFCY
jgi:hypothetical protein